MENNKTSFKDVCKHLSDSALYHIIDTALDDWQIEVAEQILAERKRTNPSSLSYESDT